jgi:hypothetical protein
MRRLTWILVFCAGATCLAADVVDDAIAKIRADVKAGNAAKVVVAIKDLAEYEDPRIRALLHDLTVATDSSIACAAYAQVGGHKDKSFLAIMRSRAEDKKLAQDRADVYAALLDAFVALGDDGKATHDLMEGLVQKYLPTNAEFSTRAIRAYGALRDKTTIDKLIGWLMQAETPGAAVGQPSGMGQVSKETAAMFDKARPVIVECLTSLTGVALVSASDWRKWWKDKKENFKCPPPPAK